jgi:Pentapeptide repeats (9 copies)
LYALERLAQDSPGQRQTIVNVLCAYLRMPSDDADGSQERQVRRAAQRTLTDHLRDNLGYQLKTDSSDTFWADMDLDLSGAVLVDFAARNCSVRSADFTGTEFHGDGWFTGASFSGVARFESALFAGDARFSGARFAAAASFDGVHFRADARFRGAEFVGDARFPARASTAMADSATCGSMVTCRSRTRGSS